MSDLREFIGGGGSQIGDAEYLPDSGTIYKRANGDELSRSGTVMLASNYPLAAKVESLMVHGVSIVTLPVSFAKITGCACNGSGTIVLCYNDATNVLVSTNSGATWALVAHNIGGGQPAYSVEWTGSKFIVAGGQNTTTIRSSYSTNASAFTAGGTLVVAENAGPGVRIKSDGSISVIVGANATATTQVVTTSDGVTLTAKTIPTTTFTSVPVILNLPSLGANRWLICSVGSTAAIRSTAADGSAWESVTLPAALISFSAGLGMFVGATATTIYTSPTGATGSWTAIVPPGLYAAGANNVASWGLINEFSIIFDGTRFVLGTGTGVGASQFAYTTDFQKIVTRQIIPNTIVGANISLACIPFGTGMIFLQNGTGTASNKMIYANNWFASCEYVGSVVPFFMPGASLGAIQSRVNYGYVKVK